MKMGVIAALLVLYVLGCVVLVVSGNNSNAVGTVVGVLLIFLTATAFGLWSGTQHLDARSDSLNSMVLFSALLKSGVLIYTIIIASPVPVGLMNGIIYGLAPAAKLRLSILLLDGATTEFVMMSFLLVVPVICLFYLHLRRSLIA